MATRMMKTPGPAAGEIDKRVTAKMAAMGLTRQVAVREVLASDPQLHRKWLQEVNPHSTIAAAESASAAPGPAAVEFERRVAAAVSQGVPRVKAAHEVLGADDDLRQRFAAEQRGRQSVAGRR